MRRVRPSKDLAPVQAVHLAHGDAVVYAKTGLVGVLETLGLRYSEVRFGLSRAARSCETSMLRHATAAEVLAAGLGGAAR